MRKLLPAIALSLFFFGCDEGPPAVATPVEGAAASGAAASAEAAGEMCSGMTSKDYDDDDVVPQPGAKIGDLTKCLISGKVFRVTKSSPHIEHKGKTYYTCCPSCIPTLEKSFAQRR